MISLYVTEDLLRLWCTAAAHCVFNTYGAMTFNWVSVIPATVMYDRGGPLLVVCAERPPQRRLTASNVPAAAARYGNFVAAAAIDFWPAAAARRQRCI